MHYFRVLGLIFGIIALLKPVCLHVLPYDEHKFLEKVYSEERPGWIIPIGILGLILVAFTWYKELSTEIKYSLIITILFSLTAIKALIFILDYEKFQEWVSKLLNQNKGKKIIILDSLVGILGLAIILVSFFIL